jgi:FkbM family methyltransferase
MGLMDVIYRSLPVFKGKDRLARIIFNKKIKGKNSFWIKGKGGCEYLVPNIIENVGFEIFVNGIYEQGTSDFIIKRLPSNGVFLDLGANIGAITIPVQSRRKDIRIYCVEAAPWVYKFLELNLERNEVTNVKTFNKALFYTDLETLNFYSPEEKFGKGSLSPVFTDKVIPVITMRVDTLTEEQGLTRVDMIKIDVEGYEYHAFRGASVLLARSDAPDIIFEFVDWAEKAAKGTNVGDAQRLLKDLGYRIFYFNDKGKMQETPEIIKTGFCMLFATKKTMN